MNATSLKINKGDQVFATMEANGRIIARLCAIDFGCIGDVINAVYTLAGMFAGIARVSIRNKSRGWSTVMMLMRRTTVAARTAIATDVATGAPSTTTAQCNTTAKHQPARTPYQSTSRRVSNTF